MGITGQHSSSFDIQRLEDRLLLSTTPELLGMFASAQSVEVGNVGAVAIDDYVFASNGTNMYQFTAPTNGRLYIDMLAQDAGIDPYLEVFAANGRRIRRNDNLSRNTKDAGTVISVRQGQTFYILARSKDGTEGSYRLRVTSEPSVLPAELFAAARTLGVPANGLLAVDDSIGELDQPMVYQFTAQARGSVTIDLLGQAGSIDTYLEVYDSTGRRIRVNDNASRRTTDSRASISVKEGETFFVVARAKRGTWGDYQLRLTSNPVDDYGDVLQSARALRLSGSGSGSFGGTLNYAGDVDFRYFTATLSGATVVSLSGGGEALTGRLMVYDAAGNVIAQSQDDSSTTVTYDAQAGQAYYLSVSGQGSSAGRYTVSIVTLQDVSLPPSGTPGDSQAQPGATVTARVVQDSSGLRLLILGTNGNDKITLSQSDSAITMIVGSSAQTFQGAFTGLVVYGFAGADTIRTTNTVTASTVIYGGDGNDTIYVAGSGTDVIFAGEGDDMIVTVGGGADRIYGEGGTDSFWGDSADMLSDASLIENALGAVHKIAQFYQPRFSGTVYGSMPTLEIAGQDLVDPTITSSASGYRNFATRPLFLDGPEFTDIDQGAIGDCYFLAALGSLASSDPQLVRQSIASLGDGTFAVRFYRGGQEVYVRVDADLPVTAGGSLVYAGLSPDGELWAALMEKAYAFFRYGESSYASLSMGWMSDVYQELTNGATQNKWVGTSSISADSLFTYLKTHLDAGHAVSAGTVSSPTGPLVGGHAYIITSVQSVGSTNYVTVYNTWGWDGRSYDSNPYDGLLTLTISQFQSNFTAAAVSLV